MSALSRVPLVEVIDALRQASPAVRRMPTAQQLRLIIDDVRAVRPIWDTLDRPEMAGFTEDDLRNAVEDFGKHRARVRKQNAPKAAPVEVGHAGRGALFGFDRTMLDSLGAAVADGWALSRSQLDETPARLFMQTHVIGLTGPVPRVMVTDVLGFDDVADAPRITVGELKKRRLVTPDFPMRASTPAFVLWSRTPADPLSAATAAGADTLEAHPSELVESAATKRRRRSQVLPLWLRQHGVPPCAFLKRSVIVPAGYGKTPGQPRDIRRSLAAAVVDGAGNDELIRFEMTQRPLVTALALDHVGLLHWFVRHDLAYKMLEFAGLTPSDLPDPETGRHVLTRTGPANARLCRLLVEAYDLLEVARQDGLTALATLLEAATVDTGTLSRAAREARWLAPADIGRIEEVLDATGRAAPGLGGETVLARRLGQLRAAVRDNPTRFMPRGVDELTAAHVLLICRASGLAADDGQEKAARVEIRARLVEMGLGLDLDREIPAGIAAWRTGRLDEFYESRQARADGDPDWRLIFEAAGEVAASTAEPAAV